MPAKSGYHVAMKRGIWALVAVFGLLWVPASMAQVNGVPASISSIGFGGNYSHPPGVPASVTSIGPAGLVPNRNFVVPHNVISQPYYYPGRPGVPRGPRHEGHHNFRGAGVAVYPVPYAVPVPVPYAEDDSQQAYEDQQDYQGGPTIFDRRGSGQPAPYAVEPQQAPAPQQSAATQDTEPIEDQPQTVLVFKDGHQLEVQNYAIVGGTLYDMTPGHPRRVALSELNVPATQQQNEDRGLSFDVPVAAD